MNRIFEGLLLRLPGKTEVPGLLEDISTVGHEQGLRFSLFKPLPEVSKEFYAELPIEIQVTGNYHQLASFVSDVSALERIVTVDDFDITLNKEKSQSSQKAKPSNKTQSGNKKHAVGTSLIMKLTAKTYRYSEENEGKGSK